jgi:hypothetical protein
MAFRRMTREIAARIVDGGGDYILTVKDNQPALHAALHAYFLHLHETDFAAGYVPTYFRTRRSLMSFSADSVL